ncbi:hypothetical protein EMIHUDRAFT_252240 [Emiliania huxleyi CCMP1516]|uniref:Uncharacterized protein n=2 Tax=Emiliania huxleyi TaxID=2903 RepID=A0A0D3KMU7_EMIH1|nr:hypothetical protein EMIHUDRAFT_252240 [Emiliania huxleyi CCMP1516]EOD37082.1 hypothetical protein EMIHUDRAFT_252240 [Emiliania huxleyi CCMP1516]|eukprot:XP_005789511.1 hypothetical protein EMIHUDRAFT_252240 [Emiliania huxleyi CCMP1516]
MDWRLQATAVEAEKRGKGKKGKKKKKGGGSGGAGPSQDAEAPSEAAAAKPAKLDREGLIRLLETLHEERIRYGITAETSVEGLAEAAQGRPALSYALASCGLRRFSDFAGRTQNSNTHFSF